MSSETLSVARKDFEDAGRSRMLWGMVGLLVAFVAVGYAAIWQFADDATAAETLSILVVPLQAILPIAALIVGYMAIVGERRSGSIKLLLGLPPTRSDVVLGKLVGRTGIVVAAVAAAFAVSAALSLAFYGTLPASDWLGLGGATVLFGLAFVGLAIGVSGSVSSRGRAMALVVGLYMVFLALWELLAAGTYYLIHGTSPPIEAEAWYLLLNRLNPILAYVDLANATIATEVWPLQFQYGLREPEAMSMSAAQRYAGEAPFYLQDWFAAVILLAWFALPVAIGYRRFQNADL